MPHFHIAYWASNAAPWRVFKRVEAESARKAIERADPQAAGRYRVTLEGSDQTAGLFRISLSNGSCELHEVTAFDRERLDRDPATEVSQETPKGVVGRPNRPQRS